MKLKILFLSAVLQVLCVFNLSGQSSGYDNFLAVDSIYLPGGSQTQSGTVTFVGPLATTARTYQLLINQSELTALVGKYIKSITWRRLPSATSAWPAADVTFSNFDLYMSGSVEPALRSLTFSENIVGPQTLVRSGSLTIPALSFPFGGDPNYCGPDIIFDTPWLYSSGHLLVELRHLGFTGTSSGVDAYSTSSAGYGTLYSACWQSGYSATLGIQGNFSVIKFTYEDSTASTFQLTVDLSSGWNMVSIPGLLPTNQNVLSWWPGKDPAAGVFKFAGGYQAVTDAVPGTGYWMKNLGAQTYNTGDEWPAGGINFVTHDPIPALLGWNLFGAYEQSVPTSGLTTTPPGLITGSIYKYSGGYVAATTLDPGYGYWVKLTGAGLINIPAPSPMKTAATVSTEGFGKITITDYAQKSYTLYTVSQRDEADLSAGVDLTQFDLPPYPPQGMFDVRYSSQRYAEKLSTAQAIEMTGVQYPVMVKTEGTGIILIDETGKEIARLKAGEEVSVNTAGKLYVTENVVPLEFSLAQNYPNPFNPGTTIEFSLPENTANVQLSIYNALGEKVSELVNTTLAAGKYTYQWSAKEFATGMYIYELRTDKFVSIKKMLLLK